MRVSLSLSVPVTAGASLLDFFFIPQNFGLGFVIQGWTVDPEEDREGKKNAKEKNERLMGRKLGGSQFLLKVFSECLKSGDEDLEGSRIIQSQNPSTIQESRLVQGNIAE